ncbi:hypothetical protein V8C44DRAFT_332149 [Trichoderma aethiopicum]
MYFTRSPNTKHQHQPPTERPPNQPTSLGEPPIQPSSSHMHVMSFLSFAIPQPIRPFPLTTTFLHLPAVLEEWHMDGPPKFHTTEYGYLAYE